MNSKPLTIPKFHLNRVNGNDSELVIVFDSDVPNDVRQTLYTILEPHLYKFVGIPSTPEMRINIYNTIEAQLKCLVMSDVLYFDVFENNWKIDI